MTHQTGGRLPPPPDEAGAIGPMPPRYGGDNGAFVVVVVVESVGPGWSGGLTNVGVVGSVGGVDVGVVGCESVFCRSGADSPQKVSRATRVSFALASYSDKEVFASLNFSDVTS